MPVQEHTLPNGLCVLLAPDRSARRVAVRVLFRSGMASDPVALRGLTRVVGLFLEDPSTRHVPRALRGSLFRTLGMEEYDVSHNVDLDETELSFTVAPTELGVALWLESDRMGFLLDGVDENTVRQKVTSVTYPSGVFAGALRLGRAELFGDAHPYGGEPTPMRAGVRDVRAYIQKHFVPRNTVISIAGNFVPAIVRSQLEEMFGPILDTPAPEPPTAPKVEIATERRIRIEANVAQPECLMLWPTAPFLEADDLVLDGLAYVLRLRLQKRLLDGKLASSTAARQISKRLGSAFHVAAAPAEGHTVDEMERLLNEEIEKIRKDGPTADEGTRAQRTLLTSTLLNLSEPTGQTYFLSMFLHVKSDAAFLPSFVSGYEAVSAAAIQRVANKYLSKGRVVVTVTPSPSAPGFGRLLKGGAK